MVLVLASVLELVSSYEVVLSIGLGPYRFSHEMVFDKGYKKQPKEQETVSGKEEDNV